MNYEETLKNITALEDVLLKERLSAAKFDDVLSSVIKLRKNYTLDRQGKYIEASQFLAFLRALIIKRERYMPNVTFEKVVGKMCLVHKEFSEWKDMEDVFKTRQGHYIDEISSEMKKKPHSMTTHRLNFLSSEKKQLNTCKNSEMEK